MSSTSLAYPQEHQDMIPHLSYVGEYSRRYMRVILAGREDIEHIQGEEPSVILSVQSHRENVAFLV